MRRRATCRVSEADISAVTREASEEELLNPISLLA
jgi:hypothetical protein